MLSSSLDLWDTQMTLPRMIEKLKQVFLYELTPRRPSELGEKRGPNALVKGIHGQSDGLRGTRHRNFRNDFFSRW